MSKIFKLSILSFAFFSIPYFSFAANLYISPSSGTYEVGDKVIVQVMVSSSGAINAISSNISVPTNIFTIESVSKGSSILNFWVTEPSFFSGVVNFEGVTLGGYSGSTGNVVTLTLRAKAQGSGSILINSGQILANDGQGTNVTGNLSGGSFVIKESSIRPVEKLEKIEKEVIPEPEVVEFDVTQKSPSLKSPEIMLIKQYGEKAISGKSEYVDAEVLLTFVSEEGVKIFLMGQTDVNGDFVILVPSTLKRGKYDVSAIVIDKDVSYTYSSNEIEVDVGSIISDIGWEIWAFISIILISFVYILVRLLFFRKSTKEIRSLVHRESSDLKDMVDKTFSALEEDLDSDIVKNMGKEEKKFIKDVKDDLNMAEKIIKKEIKDIDKI